MAGRIKQQSVEAVRHAAQVEVVVGERVSLKPAGVGSLKGLCPFHDERTPSFHVRSALGLWHCFGCSEGGDTIKFVMKADSLDFVEAVEYLAGRFGVRLEYEAPSAGSGGGGREPDAPSRSRLLEANRLAALFYANQLAKPDGRAGRDFLRQRGFDKVAAEDFGVGMSPSGWDGLLRHLTGQGFTHAELLAAGLVVQGQRGLYDRFRGRLMWPIRDLTGAVVGFGARRLSDDDQGPKYLNTPETAVYKKSQVMYGVDLAKSHIAANRRVVVVEGYTDVMACHQAGVKETVATCGTAFGADHIRVVRRLLGDVGDVSTGVLTSDGAAQGGKVVFTFDGDAAGQKAALRAFQGDQSFYVQTFVAIVPGEQDPCQLWQSGGDQAVVDLVNQAQPMFKFAIRTVLAAVDLDTPEGRSAGLRAAAPIVAGIRDDATRRDYTRLLGGWVGADHDLVTKAVKAARRQGLAPRPELAAGLGGAPGTAGSPDYPQSAPAPSPPQSAGPPGAGIADSLLRGEYYAIAAVLQHPELAPPVFDQLSNTDLHTPTLQVIHDAIVASGGVAAGAAEPKAWIARVGHEAAPQVRPFISQLAVEPLPVVESGLAAYVRGVVDQLIQVALTHQIAEIQRRLGQIQATEQEGAERASLLARQTELRHQRDQIRADQGDY
ncbi:MAG: DNA primase [Micrococcales bacterium]|nr:DNA primase [Micrococcales bacterium]